MSDKTITLGLGRNNAGSQLRKMAAALEIPIVYVGHRIPLDGIGIIYGITGMGKTSWKTD